MLPPYAVPRALDTEDRFAPGWTVAQVAWTLGGLAAGVACWVILSPHLPPSLVAWLAVYVPAAGTLAKRRVYRGWDGLAVVAALWHYTARPKRCVYLGEE